MKSELERAIEQAPDEAAPYMVYADALLEEGHPRGELIRLQQQIEPSDAVGKARLRVACARLFRTHRAALLGPLEEFETLFELEWRWGFIRRARFDFTRSLGRVRAASVLQRLFESPSAQFLRELEVGQLGQRGEYAPLVKALKFAPATLNRLALGDNPMPDFDAGQFVVGPLKSLGKTAPNLETLELTTNEFSLEGLELPKLRALCLRTDASANEALSSVASWAPKLERLELRLPKGGAPLVPFIVKAASRHPLRRLAVPRVKRCDQLLLLLADTPLVDSIEELDVSHTDFSANGAKVAAGFRHLKKVVFEGKTFKKIEGLQCEPPVADDGQHLRSRLEAVLREAALNVGNHKAAKSLDPLRDAERLTRGLRRRSDEVRRLLQLAEAHKWSDQLQLGAHCAESAATLQLGAPDNELAATFLRLASIQSELGQREAASMYLEEAQALAEASKNDQQLVYVLEARAQIAAGAEGWAVAQRYYEQALTVARRGFKYYVQHLEHMLASAKAELGEVEGATSAFESVLASQQDPKERAKALHNYGIALWRKHDWAGAEAAYRESLKMSRKLKYERNEAYCLMSLAHLHSWQGKAEQAISELVPALELFRRMGLRAQEGGALELLADCHLTQNLTVEARRYANEALEIFREVGDKGRQATSYRVLADLALNEWNEPEARAHTNQAIAIDEAMGPGTQLFVAGSQLKLGWCELLRGELTNAKKHFARAQSTYSRLNFDHGWCDVDEAFAHLCAADFSSAKTALLRAIDKATKANDASSMRRSYAWLAVVFAAQQRTSDAQQALEKSQHSGGDQSWDAQTIESLAIARAYVAGDLRAPMPIAYEARLQWELLHGWKPGQPSRRTTRSSG